MKRILVSITLGLLAVFAVPAHAGSDGTGIQASLYVFGTIDVSPQGNVTGYSIKQAGRLPPYVIKLLKQAIPAWHFKPTLVDGQPAAVETSMTIRLIAHTSDQKTYTVGIDSTSFGDPQTDDAYNLVPKGKLAQPVYPRVRGGSHGFVLVNAIAYVRVRVNREGRVTKSAVEEVDLATWGDRDQMKDWRHVFGRAAVNAAQAWRFSIPTKGRLAAMKSWDAIITVDFRQGYWFNIYPPYGVWYSYIPGPFHPAPWAKDGEENSTPPAKKGLYVVGAGLQRVNKPKGNS